MTFTYCFPATEVTEMFHNLPKLSRLFKDGLVYWLLQMAQPGKKQAFLIRHSMLCLQYKWFLSMIALWLLKYEISRFTPCMAYLFLSIPTQLLSEAHFKLTNFTPCMADLFLPIPTRLLSEAHFKLITHQSA